LPGRAQTRLAAGPPPAPRKAQAIVRRAPLPSLPNRAFESPWEELAVAYESLPVPDLASRLRWLYRASEVWETGGKDIVRAFDALARAFAHARRSPGGDSDVRARLYRLAQEHKAWDRLANLYEGIAEQAETAPEAADLLMEVATIRGRAAQPREAEAQLRRILGMLPGELSCADPDRGAVSRRGPLRRARGVAEERTDPRPGTARPSPAVASVCASSPRSTPISLNRPHDAIDAFCGCASSPADTVYGPARRSLRRGRRVVEGDRGEPAGRRGR
jgi:hypothetical protein